MNNVLKIVLSLSLSGSLLILVLLLAKPWLKNTISKRWQYYIWLVVIARLLLPFTPEVSAVGLLFRQVEQPAEQGGFISGDLTGPVNQSGIDILPARGNDIPAPAAQAIGNRISQSLWLVWLGGALLLLLRKITVYQAFVRYLRAGCTEISDIELLDRLAQIGEQMGVKRPVELCTNGLAASPLLLGFFRPCIVLPDADLPESDFEYTIRHELTHYRRRDMFYKWLVQLTVCLHWFNPLVWLMGREISRACELACDEAVIYSLDVEERRAYGETLLHAVGKGGDYQSSLASVTLHESAELLKERLGAIMQFKRGSKRTAVLSFVLAGVLTAGAAAAGAYAGPAKADTVPVVKENMEKSTHRGSLSEQAEQYYEAGSLSLFQIVFSRLSEQEQGAWLDRSYADDDIAFFSVGVEQLSADSTLIQTFAEKFYQDSNVAFFSVLADRMGEAQLEGWLEQALSDKNQMFQILLFDRLEMDDEQDALEEELYQWQLEEYRAAGVTMDGKNYYYHGQLVNIFLDLRANRSFYTLDINPEGAVNVRIIRDQDDQVTGAAYMTEAEVKALLEDASDD